MAVGVHPCSVCISIYQLVSTGPGYIYRGKSKLVKTMSNLFENAIHSIQLGVEDFEMGSAKRSISAVRNFYSGTLLLAKETLCRKVPNADEELVLAAKYEPQPDGAGGVKIVQQGYRTIDFDDIIGRFKDFDIPLTKEQSKILRSLQVARNEIEHKYSSLSDEAVKETIANVFPIVVYLLETCDEEPAEVLDEAYQPMLRTKEIFDIEFARCRKSFESIKFPFDELRDYTFQCCSCHSELVAQEDAQNTGHQDFVCICRACGATTDAETATEAALSDRYRGAEYVAYTDGGEPIIESCPECGVKAYMNERNACLWCEVTLGDCDYCGDGITPSSASFDSSSTCCACANRLSKDD